MNLEESWKSSEWFFNLEKFQNLVYEFTMLFRGMTSSPPVVVQKQFDENTTHFVFLQSSGTNLKKKTLKL